MIYRLRLAEFEEGDQSSFASLSAGVSAIAAYYNSWKPVVNIGRQSFAAG
jgi:hypothetical protein